MSVLPFTLGQRARAEAAATDTASRRRLDGSAGRLNRRGSVVARAERISRVQFGHDGHAMRSCATGPIWLSS